MSSIDIVIVTWPNHPKRWEYFLWCVGKAFREITARRHTLRWLCSSESERDPLHNWYGEHLAEWCASRGVPLTFRHGPASLGAAMNAAFRLADADYVMLLQDDFLLTEPLDLSDGVDWMNSHPEADTFRYSWPGMDRVTVIDQVDGYRRLDPNGSWPYGDDPHLRRRSFHQRFGWHVEGPPHGAGESCMLVEFGRRNAQVFLADRIYFGHAGAVPAVINDLRERLPEGRR